MLYESPSHGALVEPRAAYVRTMLGALEMLKSGVTAVLDDACLNSVSGRGENHRMSAGMQPTHGRMGQAPVACRHARRARRSRVCRCA